MLFGLTTEKGYRNLTKVVGEIASGKLFQEISVNDYPPKIRPLAAFVQKLVEMLRKFARDTQMCSSRVSAAVNQVTDAIKMANQLAQSIQQRANQVRVVSSSLNGSVIVFTGAKTRRLAGRATSIIRSRAAFLPYHR